MMKKQWIMIGIILLACGLVGGGIFLVSKFDLLPDPVEDTGIDFSPTITDEGIKVYQFQPGDVDYMEITNPHGTYRVRMTDGEVKIVGYETIPLLSASSLGLFNSVKTLSLETVVDPDCQDLSRFGLDKPQGTITIQSYADDYVTFYLGDFSPTGDYCYMCVKGGTEVYLMEEMFAQRYLKSVAEYCDRKIYKTFKPAEDLKGLTIQSPNHNYSFRVSTEEEKKNGIYFSGYSMETPFAWGADFTSLEAVLTSMMELSADSVAAMCVDGDELAQYGLDPASRIEVVASVYADPNPTMYNDKTNPYYDSTKPTGQYENFTVTYWIGKTVDRDFYVMFEGRPVVYTLAADTFEWLNWTPYRYSAKMLFGEYLSKMSSLAIVTPTENLVFTLTGADGNDKSDLRVSCGDRSIDGTAFRGYYSNLMAMYPTGEGSLPEGVDPALEILYTLSDGKTHSLKFYEMDARNYAACVDGQTFLSVRVTEVQKVINDAHKLINGQEIIG